MTLGYVTMFNPPDLILFALLNRNHCLTGIRHARQPAGEQGIAVLPDDEEPPGLRIPHGTDLKTLLAQHVQSVLLG